MLPDLGSVEGPHVAVEAGLLNADQSLLPDVPTRRISAVAKASHQQADGFLVSIHFPLGQIEGEALDYFSKFSFEDP